MAEDKRPDYRVSAEDPRTVNGSNSNVKYVQCGAAWKNTTRDGKEFISIVVSSLPVGGEFTGRLTLWPTDKKESDVPF
jgi:uncharacterized protein (DUF736 family)